MPYLLTRGARVFVVLLLASFAVGCWRPLAVRHEYFHPRSGSVGRIEAEVQHTVSHHLALQAAQHACAEPRRGSEPRPGPGAPASGPESGVEAGREQALADLCAARADPAAGARGGTSNAYRRWFEDQVRELPSGTAASATSG